MWSRFVVIFHTVLSECNPKVTKIDFTQKKNGCSNILISTLFILINLVKHSSHFWIHVISRNFCKFTKFSTLLDAPQVSISSCDSPLVEEIEQDTSSISIYESPLSSVYETPATSPSYATPSEGGSSPWASPPAMMSPSPMVRSNNINNNNVQRPQRGEICAFKVKPKNNRYSDHKYKQSFWELSKYQLDFDQLWQSI